jgi:hypothetical protein
LGRLLPRKRPSGKACRKGRKSPLLVDLFTEIRQAPQSPEGCGSFLHDDRNTLFLNNIILFKYCTEIKMALPDGHLGVSRGAYTQSYPQNLWVSIFFFSSNSLRAYAKTFSNIARQAPELA